MKLRFLLLMFVINGLYAKQIIYQSDTYTGTGDNLSSLYNAYVYAKKYNLTIQYGSFACSEQFECSNILDPLNAPPSSDTCCGKNRTGYYQ